MTGLVAHAPHTQKLEQLLWASHIVVKLHWSLWEASCISYRHKTLPCVSGSDREVIKHRYLTTMEENVMEYLCCCVWCCKKVYIVVSMWIRWVQLGSHIIHMEHIQLQFPYSLSDWFGWSRGPLGDVTTTEGTNNNVISVGFIYCSMLFVIFSNTVMCHCYFLYL